MKKLLTLIAIIGSGSLAQAQQVNWNGFYLGADAGYAWGNASTHDNLKDWCSPGDTACIAKFVGPFDWNPQGAFGGGLTGYLFQRGSLVFGPEAEVGFMDMSGSRKTDSSNPAKFQTLNVDSGAYVVLGGRVGIAFDRAFIYGKGGWAWYDTDVTQTTTNPGYVTHGTGAFDGWAYGGGIDYMIAPNWSLRAEYLHFDLGTKTGEQVSISDPPIGYAYHNHTSLDADTVKAGITFHFNGDERPLPLK